jgi:hypothetical protein
MVGVQDNVAKVERFLEDGVEVVQNFSISQDRLAKLVLSQVLSIDTEDEDTVEYGLDDIWGFDVNSSGDIFIYNPSFSQGHCILKFDRTGEFIKSFGRKGQGPGEIQVPLYQKINLDDEVSLLDFGGQKLLVFDGNGDLIRESKLEAKLSGAMQLLPLTNGNYLCRKLGVAPSAQSYNLVLFLVDSKFEKIAELGRTHIDNPVGKTSQFKYPFPILAWGLSGEHIFVGVEERGYDIYVYDFEGQLIRKIRKEYTKVPFSKESRRQALKRWEDYGSLSEKILTPKSNPPFQYLFADDLGRLYVVTFEPGNNQGEYITDVFNSEGVLYSRVSLKLFLNADIFMTDRPSDNWVTVKNDTLYCIHEKDSGHKELVAYKIIWK